MRHNVISFLMCILFLSTVFNCVEDGALPTDSSNSSNNIHGKRASVTPTSTDLTSVYKTKYSDGIGVHLVSVTTYSSEEETNPDAFFKVIRGLATDGKSIYINSWDNPIIILHDGLFKGHLGSLGLGPNEYKLPLLGLGVQEDTAWIMTEKSLLQFKEGSFSRGFPYPGSLQARWPIWHSAGSNIPLFRGGLLLLPVGLTGKPGDIATVLDETGEIIEVIQDPEFKESLLYLTPLAQNTSWQYYNGQWFCVYKYSGEVLIFDATFALVDRFKVVSPETKFYLEDFYNEDRKKASRSRNIPLFYTFQIFKGKIFLGGQKYLHCVNPETGIVENLFRFKGHFQDSDKESESALPHFSILDDGTVVLGNSNLDKLYKFQLPSNLLK